jgi:hypothetical protein
VKGGDIAMSIKGLSIQMLTRIVFFSLSSIRSLGN